MDANRGLGYTLLDDRFDDEGYSGSTLDRPALQRLLELIRSRGVDRVVVHRLDRLTRGLRHFVSLSEQFRDNGVAFSIATAPELGAAAFDGSGPDLALFGA